MIRAGRPVDQKPDCDLAALRWHHASRAISERCCAACGRDGSMSPRVAGVGKGTRLSA